MSKSVFIHTALCLPAPDIEALVQGRVIVAMPQMFIHPGREFALCLSNGVTSLLPLEQYYRTSFLPFAQTVLTSTDFEKAVIKAWAKCELCKGFYDLESLCALSQLTVWRAEALKEVLSKRPHIFLACLRVYLLPQPVEASINPEGQFVALPSPLTISESSPVLSESIFARRKDQLENIKPQLHPELEELEAAIAQIGNSAAKQLSHNIQKLLGWAGDPPASPPNTELAWIHTIDALGNANTGGNYEKGTAFEQIVHKSLAFIGFGVDPNAKGGAGGMDLYCTAPYPMVGECKAGQSIPDSTVEELIRIATRHLGAESFQGIAKLIIGPGQPTKYLQKSAQEFAFGISIINPMSLQKLVELQANYPGSVNLIELKTFLEPGQIDYRIDEYIQKVKSDLKLRSHIVQLVKKHLDKTGDRNVGVDAVHVAYIYSNSPRPLKCEEIHEILIELSSPLTGYLGRDKGSDGQSDRFYFLRDLPD